MFNKFVFSLVVLIISTSAVFGQKKVDLKGKYEKYSNAQYKVKLSGDAITGVNKDKSVTSPKPTGYISTVTPDPGTFTSTYNSPNMYYTVIYTPTGATTIYDLMSNGSVQNIFWDPNNQNNIHVVCMCAQQYDPWINFTSRRSKYYFSSNRGTSWTFIADVPDTYSGFPAVTAMSNGCALISNHLGTPKRTQWFVDQVPGLGSFSQLEHPSYMDYTWPRTVVTSSITQPTKFVTIASPGGRDSCFYTACSNLTPGMFTPWSLFNSDQAETYAIARGADGRIGIAYRVNDATQPADYGSVYYMYSTNGGISFGTPVKIYNCNFNTDSLGMLRGISMIYIANDPKVVFETIKQTNNSVYYPGAPAKIRFWSTTLPGSDPNRSIVVADTGNVGWHPYIPGGTTGDVFASLCRPVIGKSVDEGLLYVSFMVPTDYVGGIADTCSYNSVWFTHSSSGGSNWVTPVKITPDQPLRDWTYPGLSPVNYKDANYYYAHMTMLFDSIPGTYINHQGNGESLARQMFVKVQLQGYGIYPPPPLLSSPPNGVMNVQLNPALGWQNVTLANYYRVQVSLTSSFNSIVFDSNYVSVTGINIPPGILLYFTQYYWRVNASNSSGTSQWSEVWNFRTHNIGITKTSSAVPTEYKLFGNYPNPFNPTTNVRFSIINVQYVTLKIYDALGKEISTLVNERLQPGTYTVDWNATQYPSGVYFYKLSAGSFTDTKRMVLIK